MDLKFINYRLHKYKKQRFIRSHRKEMPVSQLTNHYAADHNVALVSLT